MPEEQQTPERAGGEEQQPRGTSPGQDARSRGGPQEPQPASPDERDARLAEQAVRIDELTRAYAALVEETKAFRSRMERERVRVLEAERLQVVEALLEAMDELDRALSGAGESQGPLVDGIRLTHQVLSKRIGDLGAVRLEVVGQRFDPARAEAIDVVPVSDEEQDERVVQEVRSGWRIGDRVIRPARVRVGRVARA